MGEGSKEGDTYEYRRKVRWHYTCKHINILVSECIAFLASGIGKAGHVCTLHGDGCTLAQCTNINSPIQTTRLAGSTRQLTYIYILMIITF